jgi:hypothetical protein
MKRSNPSWAALSIRMLTGTLLTGALLAASGCGGDDTYTPDACDPQHLYDIRELYAEENQNDKDIAQQRANVEAEVKKAAAKGCVTKPTYTEPLPQK